MLTTTSVSTSNRPTQTAPKGPDAAFRFVRTMSLVVVVLWHWVFATVRWDSHGPHSGNPLHLVPFGFVLTWFLQVMPLFFLIGGWASAGSLRRHRRRQNSTRSWVTKRIGRLSVPAVPLLCALIVARLVLSPWAFGVTLLAASPLWFLGVYVPLTALTPALVAAHHRSPKRAFAASLALVAATQYARFLLHSRSVAFTLLSFLAVWGTVYQIGFHLEAVRKNRRIAQIAIATGVVGMLLGGASGLSLSMVTTKIDRVSNMGPPSIQIIFLALFQGGLISVLSKKFAWWSENAKIGRLIDWVDTNQMKIYAIHLPIWVAVLVLLRCTPLALSQTPTLGWLITRPIWLLVPGLALVSVLPRRSAADQVKSSD